MRRTNGKSYKHLPDLHPAAAAVAAGLRYVSDATQGIARRRAGNGFTYAGADGEAIRDRAMLSRIRALAVPPAWERVWICARDDGHIQATGFDARGRKQYRYHRRWRAVRDDTKYGRMIEFAAALPRMRRRVARDLARPGLPREKVLALVVALLDRTHIRVGNEAYARDNDSFGLTTLREQQARVQGATLRFEFRGKSGVEHRIALTDGKLAAIVRRMQDLPGEELFCYVDDGGESRAVTSSDVNAYLKETAGEGFTSKDFRTWAGTLHFAQLLRGCEPPRSQQAAKRNVAAAIEAVAKRLGNTKAVCRTCYIHPAVLSGYEEGWLRGAMRSRSAEKAVAQLLRAGRRRERPGMRIAVAA
ncbi:MAG: DNA topoisomerase IB [Betaproteobacteria bacterium]